MDENQEEENTQIADSSFSQKLTEWEAEPSLLDLKHDLELAKPSHDSQTAKIKSWNDLLEGKSPNKKIAGRSNVQPKLIRRQAEWRYSALTEPFLGSNKIFSVSPVTFEDGTAAKQNELVLNWQFRTKINRLKFVDDLVRSDVDDGTAIIRVGWDRETKLEKEQVPIFTYYAVETEEEYAIIQRAIQIKQNDIRTFNESAPEELKASVEYYEETGELVVSEITGSDIVEIEKIVENKPYVSVLNPDNVFIDPTCEGDLDKALFVVQSFETNLSDLEKQKGRYKNLDKINWEHASTIYEPDHETLTPQEFQFKDKYRKKVVAYEYWGYYNIHGSDSGELVPIVATWIGDTLIRLEESPYPDKKLPFVLVPYLPKKRELYGEPDAELLEDNQNILGALTRGMIDLLGRSANSQQGFAKGFLDIVNKRKFENGEDYEFNPTVNVSAGHIEHKYPELPNSALTMLTLQNQEAEALTGVKSFSGGISGEAYGEVAAGIRGMLDAASKREMAILRRLAKGITDVGVKLIAMNSEFLSEEEVIRVTNDEFVSIKREDLIGNFDLQVDISTAEVDNAKSQDLAFMLQTIGPNTDFSIVAMILAEIADLKRMPELADKIRKFKPEPSEQEKMLMDLEIQVKQEEINKLRSEINLNNAKAQKELADVDKKNLDYVEQETGTTHARDIEKQQAQSQGNQNLQITKALTTPMKDGESSPNIEAALGFNAITDFQNNAG